MKQGERGPEQAAEEPRGVRLLKKYGLGHLVGMPMGEGKMMPDGSRPANIEDFDEICVAHGGEQANMMLRGFDVIPENHERFGTAQEQFEARFKHFFGEGDGA